MNNKLENSTDVPLEKKYYNVVLIIGLIVAILVACMPLMGSPGIADPKTAETGGLWINFLGRFHPLLLHLPIGALMLVFCMEGLGLVTKGKYKPKTTLAVAFAAATAVLAVVLGYFWYLTGGYNEETIADHKRDGVIFTVLMIITFLVKYTADIKGAKVMKMAYLPLLAVTGVTMMSAGHEGGEMSHGDPLNHLPSKIAAEREAENNKPIVTDPVIYTNIVHSILENKCISCHGEDKQKGDLRMDSLAAMLEGGSDEICIEPGDVEESFMLTSLDLPLDDDMHMPPKAKPQITPEEKAILTWWVEMGAPENTKISEVKVPVEITAAIATLKTPEEREAIRVAKLKQEEVYAAKSAATRERIKSSWVIVNNKFPGSLSYSSQEDTSLTFTTVSYRKSFTEADLDILSDIAADIAELDLSSTVITDAGVAKLKGFTGLKSLKLNETKVSDEAMNTIAELPALEKLNLYGTMVSDSGLQMLQAHPTLEKVYLWSSKATDAGAEALLAKLIEREESKVIAKAKEDGTEPVKDKDGNLVLDSTPEVLLGVPSTTAK